MEKAEEMGKETADGDEVEESQCGDQPSGVGAVGGVDTLGAHVTGVGLAVRASTGAGQDGRTSAGGGLEVAMGEEDRAEEEGVAGEGSLGDTRNGVEVSGEGGEGGEDGEVRNVFGERCDGDGAEPGAEDGDELVNCTTLACGGAVAARAL